MFFLASPKKEPHSDYGFCEFFHKTYIGISKFKPVNP